MADEHSFTHENDLYRTPAGFTINHAGLINEVLDFQNLGQYHHIHMSGQTTSAMAHFPMPIPNPLRFQHRAHPMMIRQNISVALHSSGPAEAENERNTARETPTTSATPLNGKRRASDQALSELKPLRLIDLKEDDDSCIICMEDYVDIVASTDSPKQEHALKMPCGHVFGSHCLKLWLREHYSCPTCRKELDSIALEDRDRREERRTRISPRLQMEYRRHRRMNSNREPEAVTRQVAQGWSRTEVDVAAERQQPARETSGPQVGRNLVYNTPLNEFPEGSGAPDLSPGWRAGSIRSIAPQANYIGHTRVDEGAILDESGNGSNSPRTFVPTYHNFSVAEIRREHITSLTNQPQDVSNESLVPMNVPMCPWQPISQRAQQRRSWRQLRISHHRPYPYVGGAAAGRIISPLGSPTDSQPDLGQPVTHERRRSSNTGQMDHMRLTPDFPSQ
ncbi:hypothetical protein RUND412_006002 [Rhizina undulata]